MDLVDPDLLRQPPDLGLAVAGDDHHVPHPVPLRQVRHELRRGRPRLIAERDGCRVGVVKQDHRLHAGGALRQQPDRPGIDVGEPLPVGQAQLAAADDADQALARALGHGLDGRERKVAVLGIGDDGGGQRVLRILFDGRRGSHDVVAIEPRCRGDLRDHRPAVGQRSGLVEHDRLYPADFLEHRRILDDDAALRRQRDRADDGHRHADEQRARRRDDDDRQEARRVARYHPAQDAERERHQRVPPSEAVGHAAHRRPIGLRLAQHADDLGVPRIDRGLLRAHGQGGLTVDRAGDDRRTLRLLHHVRLAGQVGLVHRAIAVDDLAVDRAQLMRQDQQQIPHRRLVGVDVVDAVGDGRAAQPVGDRRAALGQRVEGGRRALRRGLLQRLAAGEHEHDDRRDQPFPQQDRRNDGHRGEHVRAAAGLDRALDHVDGQGDAADDDHRHQRPVRGPALEPEAELQHQVDRDGRQRGQRQRAVARRRESPQRLPRRG